MIIHVKKNNYYVRNYLLLIIYFTARIACESILILPVKIFFSSFCAVVIETDFKRWELQTFISKKYKNISVIFLLMPGEKLENLQNNNMKLKKLKNNFSLYQ